MTQPLPPVPDQPYGAPYPYAPPGAQPYPPPYPQPGYPQQGYPPFGPPVRAVNPIGIVLAMVGGAAVLISAFLPWYSANGSDTDLGDIVHALDGQDDLAVPTAYFGWLMWVVVAAAVVTALFASLPGTASRALRVISPILGAVGAIGVLVSLGELIKQGSIFDNSAAGLYLTLAGFVAVGIGGLLGPRRVR